MKLFIESLLERRLLIGKRRDKGISLRADLQKYHGKSLIESQPGLGKWVSGEMFGNGGGALADLLSMSELPSCVFWLSNHVIVWGTVHQEDGFWVPAQSNASQKRLSRGFTQAELPWLITTG